MPSSQRLPQWLFGNSLARPLESVALHSDQMRLLAGSFSGGASDVYWNVVHMLAVVTLDALFEMGS